jgi:diguanylate cyclase (GGDEF)-like protein
VRKPAAFLSHPVVPLAVILLLAFGTLGLRLDGTDWRLVATAAAVSALALAAAILLPWSRLPPALLLGVPVLCDVVIALMRHAQGGSTSGYGPLSILPVVWVGFVLSRRETAAITACTVALFVLPIVILGAPLYPSNGWRGVILWSIVCAMVGFGANRVTAEHRRATRAAAARATGLATLVSTQEAIATTRSDLDAVLERVVQEARRLTGAAAAVVELPDGDDLVYRAVAGTASGYLGLRLAQDTAISGLALRTRRALVCEDSDLDPRVDRDACRRVGARSMIVVPLLDEGDVAGVLKVYSPVARAFEPEDAQLLSLLAGIIGTAVGRAELLRRLREEAITDELTGLPNRRAWYHDLELAVARSRRSGRPLSVVVLDLDHFKEINDRDGHVVGDRLLRTVAGEWSSVLRESDVLGRLGGDEFGVILEGADEVAAADLIDRLAGGSGNRHGASAGSATWDGEEDLTALVARADERMYERKRTRAGRLSVG